MSLIDEIRALGEAAVAEIARASNSSGLEELKVRFLGKKGRLTAIGAAMRTVAKEEKPVLGQALNRARQTIAEALDRQVRELQAESDRQVAASIDPTLPGRRPPLGAVHPLTQVEERAIAVLRSTGFALADGPEIETEFHCFDALNTPTDHPARNEKDTFYFDDGNLLRTHTSTVQIRAMEKEEPPLRIIAPGSAYRRDEIDSTHLSVFHQIEGLYVAGDVCLGDLKGTLETFFRTLFGPETPVRFRPHFFPFTEPSYEIDIRLQPKGETARWIEIAGCGMVDPAVFSAVCESRGDDAYDPDRVTGFAFGLGLERLAMIMWGIPDIRMLIENDLRFLAPFRRRSC